MLRDNEEDESLKKNNPVVHYRFKRKIEFLNCHLQLYIAEDKIKFIVNCIEEYSDEFKEYSNDFSLYQLQELSKYFNFFEKIEDILEDLASILKLDSYDIEKNSNTMTVILHVSINEELGDVNLTLFRKKSNNYNSFKKPSQIVQNIKNSDNRKRIVHKSRNNKVEPEGSGSGTNVGVKSIRELNNLLTELKDRITVLEVTQNTSSQNQPIRNKGIFSTNLPTSEKLFSLGSSSLVGNENILLNMDSIIKRINKLEEANTKKSEKIKYLEEKLRVYDPMFTVSENDSLNDNNFNFNNANYNYINLGSIKKKDTNTMNSNNTNLNNTLLEIKEELNSSSSSKHRNKSKNKGINNKDNNMHESNKRNKSKDKDKEKKHKSKSKSKSKNKKKQEKDSYLPNNKNINYNNNKNNKDNNEVFNDNYNNYNNKYNKSARRKSKSRNNDKIKEKKLKNNEEIICTDIKEPKNKQSNMRKIVHEVDDKDSEKLINNLEKYLNNDKKKTNTNTAMRDSNKNKDKDNLKEQNVNDNDIQRNSSFNKDNNEVGYSNNIEKKNTRNYDNNDNDDAINNNINNINNVNNDNNIDNNDNSINNHYSNNAEEKKDESLNRINSIKEENKKEELKRKESNKEKKESDSNNNSIEIIKKNEKKNKKKKILPIVEKEKIRKYVNSEIIFTKKELKLLKTKINDGNKNLHVFFDLLYRATEEGDNAEVIKKKIKDIHKTLTLFYTEEGARFGIYIEKEIRYSIFGKSLKEKEGTSFLISLNNCIIYDILGENIATENKGDMLCFIKNKQKNKNGSSWAIFTPPKEFLGKSYILGDVTYVFDIEDNDEIIGDKNEYHLKEVEIFEVAIEEGDDYNNYEGEENNNIKNQNETNENNISNNKSTDGKDENKHKVEYTISNSDNNNINNKDKNEPSNEDKDDDNNEFYLSGIIKGIHDK